MDELRRVGFESVGVVPRAARGVAPVLLLTLILGLLVAASLQASEETTLYGEALRETKQLRVSELLEDPQRWVDQRVQVVGLVDDVCPMKGCWVEILEQGKESQTVRFKVEDDVIVFPATAKGREIVAEGLFTARTLDVDAARRWLAHLAEERGESFDGSTVTEPLVVYEIAGEGAELGAAPDAP